MKLRLFKKQKNEKKEFEQIIARKNALNDFLMQREYTNRLIDAEKRQCELDLQKYFESQHKECDMSGRMYYCAFCSYCLKGDGEPSCVAEQKTRMEDTLCATAYKKYKQDWLYQRDKDFTMSPADDNNN